MKKWIDLNVVRSPAIYISIILSVLLSACAGDSLQDSPTANVGAGSFTDVGGRTAPVINGAAAASAQRIFAANAPVDGNNDDYKISALDVLEITVLNVPELTRTVQVNTSGTITLPLVKSIKAANRTQTQLERDIASKLEANYLQSPQVSVYVKEYNSQKVTVDGAVIKPGIFPKNGNMSLLQAIAQAEGLNTVADPTAVLVFRTVENKRMAARFDLKQIRSGKISDPMLQAGDIVMVDESSTRTTLRDITSAMPLTGLFSLLAL
jgi:polysaccharide biosynthesis/export protein